MKTSDSDLKGNQNMFFKRDKIFKKRDSGNCSTEIEREIEGYKVQPTIATAPSLAHLFIRYHFIRNLHVDGRNS